MRKPDHALFVLGFRAPVLWDGCRRDGTAQCLSTARISSRSLLAGDFSDGKRTDEHCFSWIYGGKFLRDQHTVRNPGQPDYLGETIYFWNSSQHRIEYLYIENDGGFSMGAMSTDKDELIFAPANHITDGATQT